MHRINKLELGSYVSTIREHQSYLALRGMVVTSRPVSAVFESVANTVIMCTSDGIAIRLSERAARKAGRFVLANRKQPARMTKPST